MEKENTILNNIAIENGFDTWEQYFECFRTTEPGRSVINKGILKAVNTALQLETKSDWVRVKDRLPEHFGSYTACLLNDGIVQIHFENLSCDGRWYSLPPFELHEDNPVTHWMQLPEPPKR